MLQMSDDTTPANNKYNEHKNQKFYILNLNVPVIMGDFIRLRVKRKCIIPNEMDLIHDCVVVSQLNIKPTVRNQVIYRISKKMAKNYPSNDFEIIN